MAALTARTDWSRTPVGPAEQWPDALRTTLEIVLANRFPMVFWWGSEQVQFYNDHYRPMLGAKHPRSLGQTAKECWGEIWDVIGPQIEQVYSGGPSTWNEDLLLDINRHGFIEETYFTFSYSSLPDPSAPKGIGGVLGTVQETTQKVIGERRIRLLRDLAAHATEALTTQEECRLAAATLSRYPKSVPFSLIYLIDETRTKAHLAAAGGIEPGTQGAPLVVDLLQPDSKPWPLRDALRSGDILTVANLDGLLDVVPSGPWPEPPREAIVVAIPSSVAQEPAGFLVAGVNPRTHFDDAYRGFFRLVVGQIASAISNALAYEAEKKRAEALAEIDRAKNAFFSNVSHEFRTPLTLMLGPLEELARTASPDSSPLVEAAHRNALRLLKLVNTLLEFSRLEAGRNDATFVETDVGAITRDLCSMFRSAIESAGLRFSVNANLRQTLYVDRSMWEKIVLNLLSNALKFTLEGEIRVALRTREDAVELEISDTGVGIPEPELPHLFERFRRIRGAKSRSHEGSGIGLALVDELVRLHGGSITVESALGEGTTFRILIPLGTAHLESTQVATDVPEMARMSAVEQYLADLDATITRAGTAHDATSDPVPNGRPRILLADDNGDLREYVKHVLAAHYDVVAVTNGLQALHRLQDGHFDLVLSDVMMPEMDGFELLNSVRQDQGLAETPFIMLSARAGEESKIEGLQRGADDYLVKPFSAEELRARIYAALSAASVRAHAASELRASEERFRNLTASMPHIVQEADAQGRITFLSEAFRTATGDPPEDGYGDGWGRFVHPDDLPAAALAWKTSLETGEPFEHEFRMHCADGSYRWYVSHARAQRDANGRILRWTGTVTDIDELKRAGQEREILARASRILGESLDLGMTLQNLAQLIVPHFGDWCQIDLRVPDGRIRTVAIAHRDPEKHTLAQQFVGRIHLNPNASGGVPYVIRTGRSDLIADARARALERVGDEAELRVYEQLGIGSAAYIPLSAQGKTVGAIAVFHAGKHQPYTPEDLPLLEEIGRRAGLAVQHATAFEREHRVAESFQDASLPPMLPEVPGLTFDAIYIPGSTEAQVGGDWYDAVRLMDGRVVISIGDVTGHGLHAAVTMGNMRQIIRGIAQVHADPALMLDAADRALRLEHPEQLVSAFVGVLDPIARTLSYASAGHPPPMLRYPDGEVQLLSDNGLLLGLRHKTHNSRGKTITIPDGSYLVFYTDGLTESSRAPAEGEEDLTRVLREGSLLEEAHPALALRDALIGDVVAKDDVAILVMGIATGSMEARHGHLSRRWMFEASDAQAGRRARREFAELLSALGGTYEQVHAAEVVFGELVGNAARHAPGPVEVAVDLSGPAPVLNVLDNGRGFHYIPALPADVYSESGRGLYLISLLSEDFHVSKRAGGGSQARAVLACHIRPPGSVT